MDNDDELIYAFPLKLSDHIDANTSRHPTVTVEKARSDIFPQYKCEYVFIKKIQETSGGQRIVIMERMKMMMGELTG